METEINIVVLHLKHVNIILKHVYYVHRVVRPLNLYQLSNQVPTT